MGIFPIILCWLGYFKRGFYEEYCFLAWLDVYKRQVLVPAVSFAKVTAGTVMKVYFDQKDQTWAQAQFNYGDWSGIAFSLFDTTMVPTDIYGWSFESRVMELTLTQEILDNIQAKQGDCEDQTNVGIIIQGSDLTFTKITIVN